MGMSLSYWGREAGFNKKRRTTRTHLNGKFQQRTYFKFQQEITGLQYLAYLSEKKMQDSTGNSRFIIFGFSQQQTKFEGSWIQQEITVLQYWAYFNEELNLKGAGFNRKRRVARTHFNGKL